MSISRRGFVTAGALTSLAAAVAIPQAAQAEESSTPEQIPIGVSDGSCEAVLTSEAARILENKGLTLTPTAPATAVAGHSAPSVHLPLALGATTPTALDGYVLYDGGFLLEEADASLELYEFASDLITGSATALARVNGTTRDRLPAFTYDVKEATIEANLERLTVKDLKMHVTEEFAALLQEVFGTALFAKDQEFAVDMVSAQFEPATPQLPGIDLPKSAN